ncbi:MAG: DedA family protein [Halapricum sp.]
MAPGLVDTVLTFVRQYGYLAVFVYMALETAFILHYVPSEVVVPFAAAELVHDPLSFVLFVLDATAGATAGSVIAYVLFGRYGRQALERYGHLIHVSPDRLDWSQRLFARYGESSVFWGRMLPLLRAFISIPAGIAEMDFRRFTVYSAAGALLFNTGLTYLVYVGAGTTSPLEVVVSKGRTLLATEVGYVQAHTQFVIVVVGLVVVGLVAVWLARDWIRSNPGMAAQLALHAVRIVGLFVGGVFVLGALSAPEHAFSVVTAVWDDPLFWVRLGFTEQVTLLLFGLFIAFAGLLVYELGQLVETARLRAAAKSISTRFRQR